VIIRRRITEKVHNQPVCVWERL